MAATKLIVIYASRSGILRRKIIPDDDAQLDLHQPGPGESRLLLPLDRRHDDAACRAAVEEATGVTPPSGRCAVLDDNGQVVAICHADPALDAHPSGRLMLHDSAALGDRLA